MLTVQNLKAPPTQGLGMLSDGNRPSPTAQHWTHQHQNHSETKPSVVLSRCLPQKRNYINNE